MESNYGNSIKLSKPPASEMCPPGYHVVRGHERTCHSGTRTWVDAHIRRNRGSNPQILLIENIHHLYWASNTKYGRIGKIHGFPENAELDTVIQFWLDYWKEQGLKFPTGLDPLLVKTIIAIESSFKPKEITKIKGSSATGLMQITNETRGVLSGRPRKGYRELKSNYFELSQTDVQDPIVAVAAGTRWLAHKYSMIPKRAEKTLHNTIKNYHSWDNQGEAYAKSVEELYQKSKKGR
ncbi:MAG: transglycosylase SLT domain-containing protein [Bdellovibrionales bacterium]|nr:transglycosylase SLT domain-containing protein [Bdellovibrionales bacterium]